ncbi:hypothetical protein SDC9_84814 [bioreactor metagenome]|uniref:Uncharacterized protein n=1 Tax=bioreactor metagenome TaxID=1076179 RepID=A0A644ZBX8_9ZZZZ|nr:hypothetical protein [Desulfovibrio desulfuricans]MCB6541567.1 hypothetical protein [Desulfovibrio desulfuricans]MCB6552648.1 hypothetical protein [Desulfovibrio desulfuricans]MCB6564426.1 hypothetical protein [Desulfovibrio desulfuricans]MCB7345673.1 hypothetical protein [Desulfovibrio desulfuricans]MCQ4861122.1 hypothetical protein [Desulfovibrio desulfuricans]
MSIAHKKNTLVEQDQSLHKNTFQQGDEVILDGESEKKYCDALCFKERCKGWAILAVAICAIKKTFFSEKKAIVQ